MHTIPLFKKQSNKKASCIIEIMSMILYNYTIIKLAILITYKLYKINAVCRATDYIKNYIANNTILLIT